MLTKTMKHGKKQDPAKTRAMITAVLGAVADFPAPPEEKLKAIIQAGRIAEAFVGESAEQHSVFTERMEDSLVDSVNVSRVDGPTTLRKCSIQ
jgi:hypothetical protein